MSRADKSLSPAVRHRNSAGIMSPIHRLWKIVELMLSRELDAAASGSDLINTRSNRKL